MTSPRVEVVGWEDAEHGSVFDLRLISEDDLTIDERTLVRNLTPTALACLISEASSALAGHLIDREEPV